MPTWVISSSGDFECDGPGRCGSSDYRGKEAAMRTFNCRTCDKFNKEKLRILDNRGETSLGMFIPKG